MQSYCSRCVRSIKDRRSENEYWRTSYELLLYRYYQEAGSHVSGSVDMVQDKKLAPLKPVERRKLGFSSGRYRRGVPIIGITPRGHETSFLIARTRK